MLKRIFDTVFATLGVIVLSPLLVIVGILIKLTSHGPVFFRQERIGKDFRPFLIFKFRTMICDAWRNGGLLTISNDPRVTWIGKHLRQTKLDELPQLFNVLKGEMSLVGPRPEVRKYVEMFPSEYREILRVRPGLTDLASLKYRDEAAVLGHAGDAEEEYRTRVLPDKIRLAQQYVKRSSLLFDVTLIMRTLLSLTRSVRTYGG